MQAEIAGLLGTLVGACVSIVTTYLSNKHSLKMQASADAIERQEKARAFQRDNLLACQESLQVLARLTAQAFHADAMALRQGVVWGKNRLPDQLDEDLGVAKRKFSMLVERVENDQVRKELKSVSALLNNVVMGKTYEAADGAFNIATEASVSTMELLGTVLRKTY